MPRILAGVMKLDHVDEVVTFQAGDRLDLPCYPSAIHTSDDTECRFSNRKEAARSAATADVASIRWRRAWLTT